MSSAQASDQPPDYPMTYERENIANMHGYIPGEQPDSPDIIKLNTNENPYSAPDPVIETLRHITGEMLRKYPPPTANDFRQVAAQTHEVASDNIIPTNAGDELLRLAITTFVEPGATIAVAEPSYSLYPVLAAAHGAGVLEIQRNDDWSLPRNLAQQISDGGAQLTLIVNPNAPTGTLTSVADLKELAEAIPGVLLIDEAYVDFVDPDQGYDAIQLIGDHPNVLILRTLSKGYSLAGLRFGYGIGHADLISPMLTKTRDSYNTDLVSQKIATAALTHRPFAQKTWEAVRQERDRMVRELHAFGILTTDSHANFVLATIPGDFAGGAANLYQTLKQRGIFVRYFDLDRLGDKLRITIGTPDQNTALLNALKELAT